jgi:hypothetical protein
LQRCKKCFRPDVDEPIKRNRPAEVVLQRDVDAGDTTFV